MVYSIRLQKEVPVIVSKKNQFNPENCQCITQYTVMDASEPLIHVGYVDLLDTNNGVEVLFIKSQHPNYYRHFGEVADQIEVEHCMQRGIDKPYIKSVAAFNSHIQHFKRGKRFINEGVNIFLENLISGLLKGQIVLTKFLGNQPMFMPQNMVNVYKKIIEKAPLLK